ncbi:MAG: hypothetical protein P7H58_24700 [Microcoleus anatoxicus]
MRNSQLRTPMRYFIFINVFNLAATGHGDRLPDFHAPRITD